MEENNKQANLDLEYGQINNNIRFLAEVRFKLLALVPALGGAAVFVLAHLGLEAGKAMVATNSELLVVLLVSLFGFLATLGITLYDQRNSELYNALMHRAAWIETECGFLLAPGGHKQDAKGGQYNERPMKSRRFFFMAGHDIALALIYGPLLGGWFFPILYSALRLGGSLNECAQTTAIAVAAVAALGCTAWLIALDKQDNRLYNLAAERDDLK